jgi:glutaminyl-peptide cyclotransferase
MRLRIADHSIADCGLRIADLLNTTRNLQSTTKGVMFSIRNPQSAIRKVMFSIRNLALLVAAVLTLACADGAGSSKPPVENTPVSRTGAEKEDKAKTTAFDGERAFNHVKAQVESGGRPPSSPAIEKTREYIVRELKGYGLKTTLDEFSENTPRGKVNFKNVVAELPGESSNVIIIASHYDTKRFKEFTFVGANDGGSSTGALLEIARVMAAESQPGNQDAGRKRKYTYWFVFFDGEEAFCREWSECLNGNDHTYGSRYMVERLQKEKQLSRLKAMILLDMIGDRDLTIPEEEGSSQWLVEAIWGTARQIGHAKEFPDRPFSIGDDDHMPFLRAGVPAVDIIDFEYGSSHGENDYWHTKEDTLDKISPRSLKIVGDVILLSLPKIEAQIR